MLAGGAAAEEVQSGEADGDAKNRFQKHALQHFLKQVVRIYSLEQETTPFQTALNVDIRDDHLQET